MTMHLKPAMIALACLAAGGCGGDQTPDDVKAGMASGKILERSVTDEMLPYDTVTSQAPRAVATKHADGQQAGGTEAEADAEAGAAPVPQADMEGPADATPAAE